MGCGTSKPPVVAKSQAPQERRQLKQETTLETETNTRVQRSEIQKFSNSENKLTAQPKAEPIDSSEFHSLSYKEVAALRPSDPGNMWAIVKRTCDNNREWKLDSVKNRRGWKTIRLFVSSTFRDFHPEREVLVKEVNSRIFGTFMEGHSHNYIIVNVFPYLSFALYSAVFPNIDVRSLSIQIQR